MNTGSTVSNRAFLSPNDSQRGEIPWLIRHRSTIFSTGLIIVACLVAGWVATLLNTRFYTSNQPFFDSLSYHNSMHYIMLTCQEKGLVVALREACTRDTVCLPYVIAAFAGLLFEPSRYVGIWVQVGELTIFCISIWVYMRRIQAASVLFSLFCTAPFLVLHCLYMNNGGLSDFRMDLSLALLFGTTCVWYLIASKSDNRWPYLVLGVTCAAACLFRGTAPVYIILALGPIALLDCVWNRQRPRYFQGLAIATATATILGAWFYIANFEHLHYYYFVWNTDANAQLSWQQASEHFRFVGKHIGIGAFGLIAVIQSVMLWERFKNSRTSWSETARRFISDLGNTELRLLWIALAPVLFLVARGAGLNPYVCMPSAVGLCLFGLLAIPMRQNNRFNLPMILTIFIAFGAASGHVFKEGWEDHRGESPVSMAAHQQTIDALLSDARKKGVSEIKFGTTHSYYLNTMSVESVATFDHKDAEATSTQVSIKGVTLDGHDIFGLAAEADWARTPGDTDEDKVQNLVSRSQNQLDYLIIPTEECAVFLKESISHNVVNRYAVTLRNKLLATGNWEVVSDVITNRIDEKVQVFSNRTPKMARIPETSVMR